MTETTTEFPSITCPSCGSTSYNIHDVEYEYCGKCHAYHSDLG